MINVLLVINAGSSSIKASLFGLDENLPLLAECQVRHIGESAIFDVSGNKDSATPLNPASTHEEALNCIIDWIETHETGWIITAAIHRVVHGGADFIAPVIVTDDVLRKLKALSPLAPLHQPHNLAAIEILCKIKPALVQLAAFDTAFHANHEHLFRDYALPEFLRREGIRRYGFHGLSYEWIATVLAQDYPELAKGRIIVAHLGNGASLCAMREGQSIDTTMGMTALDGLPMGTRCGSLDPGAVLYMINDLAMSPDEVRRILYNDSGLKGLSGRTNDVETLLSSLDPQAALALDFFALKTAQFIAAMAVSIEGVDGIVFTGGIGENATSIRKAIMKQLEFLGPIRTLVIPANEDRIMAIHAYSHLKSALI